jgi:type I restriction enzyme R subunit
MSTYTEDHLVEQPAIQLMQHELGWDVVNCFGEWTLLRQGSEGQAGGVSDLGREGKREVVLTGRLKAALLSLNPDLPEEAIDGAVEEMGILDDGFWILNGRVRRTESSMPLLLQILNFTK